MSIKSRKDDLMSRVRRAAGEGKLLILDDLFVSEWTPSSQGRTSPRPTEIHLIAEAAEGLEIVVRLKSFAVVQELIDNLENYKRSVYPEASRERDRGYFLDTDDA